MLNQENIDRIRELIENNFIFPISNHLETLPYKQMFLNDIESLFTEKHLNGKFMYSKFPFRIAAVSLEKYCGKTTQREIEFFCNLFRSKLFINMVLNRKDFAMVTLQESLDFIEKGEKIDTLNDSQNVFVFMPEGLHIQLIQILNSKDAMNRDTLYSIYYDSDSKPANQTSIKKFILKLYPNLSVEKIKTKQGKCPVQTGETCALSAITNFLFISRSNNCWKNPIKISFKTSAIKLFKLYYQILVIVRNICLIEDVKSVFKKYEVFLPNQSKGIIYKHGTFKELVRKIKEYLVKEFGFKDSYNN